MLIFLNQKENDVTRVKYDFSKRISSAKVDAHDNGYYGVQMDGLYVDDLALIKLNKGLAMIFEEREPPFATFELINETKLKDTSLIPFLTIDNNTQVKLHNNYNNEEPVVYMTLSEYFKTERKTFSITDDFEYPLLTSDNKYNKYRLYHHLPNFFSYSGSPIGYLDKNGKLHPFAIQTGGFVDWNVAITSNHPFLAKIIEENDQLYQDTGTKNKLEL